MDRGGEYPRCLWKYNIWQAKQFISNTVATGGRGKSNPTVDRIHGEAVIVWAEYIEWEGKGNDIWKERVSQLLKL